jgi:hypothetical protein
LLLTLAGVTPEDIIADYELSPDPDRDKLIAHDHSSTRAALLGALAGLDIDSHLRKGGVSQAELTAVRERLLGGRVNLVCCCRSPLKRDLQLNLYFLNPSRDGNE